LQQVGWLQIGKNPRNNTRPAFKFDQMLTRRVPQEVADISTRRENHIGDTLISMRFMRQTGFIAISSLSVGAAVLLTAGIASLRAQGPGGGQTAQALFAALDTDKDGTLTRPELESGFHAWFTAWDTTHYVAAAAARGQTRTG
jgi:hypothetical protein